MKNADIPAMPFVVVDETQSSGWGRPLPQREMIAMHTLSGLLSDPNWTGTARDAVKFTEQLLRALETPAK